MRDFQFLAKRFAVCLILFSMCFAAGLAAEFYVDDNAVNDPAPYEPNVSDPLEDGSLNHPFDRIQEGIDVAAHGDTVRALPGTYYENIYFDGKNIQLASVDPNIADNTIINGNGIGSVVTFDGTEPNTCVLQGFTITNGYAVAGGGINGNYSAAIISKCIIEGNFGNIGGGLVWCSGTINQCYIRGNSADYGGGVSVSTASTANCIIAGNAATYGGGGLDNCDGIIENCTIAGNSAGTYGGGLLACYGSQTNCIIWYNSAPMGANIRNGSTPTYSCIQSWTGGGTGNIISDPDFIDVLGDPVQWDFHLQTGSSCIDRGTNTPPDGLSPTDIEGVARALDGDGNGSAIADMGAYEYTFTEPCISVSNQTFNFAGTVGSSNPSNQTFTVSNIGNGMLNWNIDVTGKPQWLTITPVSGGPLGLGQSSLVALSVDITGLATGSYSYVFQVAAPGAQNSPKTIMVNLQMNGPVLSVSRSSVSFSGNEGGANPNDQLFTVMNTGSMTMNWAITDANEPTFSPPTWLTILPNSGGPLGHNQSTMVTLSVNITGLSAGSYSYAFQVMAPTAQFSPRIVTVNLQVVGPILQLSETHVSFGSGGDDPNYQTLIIITNGGGGTLNWSIDDSGRPDWLAISPVSGGPLVFDQSSTVTLSVDTVGLADGSYCFSFDVVAAGAESSPQTVTVYLSIVNGAVVVPTMYSTIQDSINAAVQGSIIIVLPGTYNEAIDFKGKNITLRSVAPEVPAVVAATIIRPPNLSSHVRFSGTETPACVFTGFTIKERAIIGNGTLATISNCICSGAGSYIRRCNGTIEFCLVQDCSGIENCDGTIRKCTVQRCSGSGLYDCDGLIDQCIIINNQGCYGGGLESCHGTISNCLISGNGAHVYRFWDGGILNPWWIYVPAVGGGLYNCNGTIVNCTIVNNISFCEWDQPSYGGGLCYCNGTILNCIIWGNEADNGPQLYSCSLPVYSCIMDWTAGGTGNITGDPLFADVSLGDPNFGDMHLKSQYGRWNPVTEQWVVDVVTSPCIDAGHPASEWQTELWPHGGRINMGAYGGTPEASMSGNPIGSIADLDSDDYVNTNDLILFAADWLLNKHLLPTDLNRDCFVDLGDFSEFSAQWLMCDELPRHLPAPTGLTAVGSCTKVTLDWNDQTDPLWAGFNVYRSTTPGVYTLIAEDLQVSNYSDLSVTNGITYYYIVTAMSTTGSESVYSSVVSAIPALAAPTGLSATASYNRQISLNWNDHTDPLWAGFNVYRNTVGTSYTQIAAGLLNSEYIDSDINQYTLYYYRVSAVSINGYESWSQNVSALPRQLENQNFESGTGNWTNVTSGDTDQWYYDSGGTGTSNTGPSAGANGSTWYVYMETGSGYAYTAGDSAIVQGPEMADSGRARAISFYYHMYGADMGTLNLDVYSGGVWTNGVWSISGQQHTSETDAYTQAIVDLGAFTGTIRVRFRGVAAGGDKGDMAIDDLWIYEQ